MRIKTYRYSIVYENDVWWIYRETFYFGFSFCGELLGERSSQWGTLDIPFYEFSAAKERLQELKTQTEKILLCRH